MGYLDEQIEKKVFHADNCWIMKSLHRKQSLSANTEMQAITNRSSKISYTL